MAFGEIFVDLWCNENDFEQLNSKIFNLTHLQRDKQTFFAKSVHKYSIISIFIIIIVPLIYIYCDWLPKI